MENKFLHNKYKSFYASVTKGTIEKENNASTKKQAQQHSSSSMPI